MAIAALSLFIVRTADGQVRLLRFAEAKQFRMGAVVSNRIVHPDMGAKKLTLNYSVSQPGNEFAQHTHDDSDDTILILQGSGDLRQGDSRRSFAAGQAAFIPRGQIHGTITTGAEAATMISFQTPPDLALYTGARDSSRAGAAPPKGATTPGAVKFVEFAQRNGFFVHPGMGAARIAVAHWKLKPGEKLSATVPREGEQVLFIWKGAIAVRHRGGSLQAGERDAVFASGPAEFEIRNESSGEAIVIQAHAPPPALPKLKVSDDKRFLVTAGGQPFFYLADTAWELLHRLDRKQAAEYLDKRAAQRYTAIQAVALAELDGVTDPNPYGDLPLIDKDPTRPAVTPGTDPNDAQAYDYWDHVEYIVDQANARGLYIALLPSWGRWVNNTGKNDESLLTPAKAQTYGEFLGRRFGGKGIIWVLGGDRTATGFEATWRALARGIAAGAAGREDYEAVLMSFHPRGGETSSTWFHDDAWLDFNMHQTGHGLAEKTMSWARISKDYERSPVKPVIDGEPLYEDHPLAFRARDYGYSFDAHVRQRAWWAVFSGACGHTYGNHSVWQMYAPGRRPINGPLLYWHEAIHRPGAAQMQYVRALIESRPYFSRVPDQSLVANALEGADRIAATRGQGYAFVYSAQGRKFTVNMGKISGARVKAWWYNPRTGTASVIDTFENSGVQEFTCPSEGFGSDWVLALDDVSKDFPPPGAAP